MSKIVLTQSSQLTLYQHTWFPVPPEILVASPHPISVISYIICGCCTHCIREFVSMHGKRIPETAYDEVFCIYNLFTQTSILKCLLSLRSASALFSPTRVCPPPVEDISVLSCPSLVNFLGVSKSFLLVPPHP